VAGLPAMPPDPARVRLYLDEDTLSRALVAALRSRGVDVLTAHDADMAARPDVEHLRYATGVARTVLSCNVADFVRLHDEFMADGRHHGGVVVTAQLPVGVLLRRTLRLMHALSALDMQDRLEFLSTWR
jgi:hypothetical protein